MQRNLRHRLSALAALAALLLAGCGEGDSPSRAARSGDALILVTTASTPPYSYIDEETGEIVGIEIDIARAAAKRLGRPLEVQMRKFEGILSSVKFGEVDMAAAGLAITEARKRDVDFSVSYADEGGMFLYRAGEPMPTMIRAERMHIAVVDSQTHDFYLCSHGIDPVRFRDYGEAVAALEAGKVDAVFFDSCTVRATVAASGGKLAASRLETRERLGFAVHRGLTDLKAALDAVIAERKGAQP